MYRAERTPLHDDVAVGPVVRVLVGKGSLAAFQHNGVVVYVHVAAAYQYVVAIVYVYGVAARRLHACGRGVDVAANVLYVVAAVQVVSPKGAVYQPNVLHLHVAAVGQIDEPRAQSLEVGAILVEPAPYPKLLPKAQTVAVYRAVARYGETV